MSTIKKKNYWGDEQEKASCDYIKLEHELFGLTDKIDRLELLYDKSDCLTFEEKAELEELTENISSYNQRVNQIDIEKRRIYNTYLYEPLNTMTDCIIRRYNLYSDIYEYDDLHTDTISYLLTKMHKYSPERVSKKTGLTTKAYSYFQTIIKHKLLANIQNKTKDLSRYTYYEDAYKTFGDDEKNSYTIDERFDNSKKLLVAKLLEHVSYVLQVSADTISTLETKVGKAIIDILDNHETIFEASSNNKLNKNSILYILREMTNVMSTKDIRTGIKPYKAIYYMIKDKMIFKDEL